MTRHRYFASARALNQVPKPGVKTLLEFRTQDANSRPVSVRGSVKITRERWTEIWLDPARGYLPVHATARNGAGESEFDLLLERTDP